MRPDTMVRTDTDIPSRPASSLPAALEETYAALHRDAASAARRLRQPPAPVRRGGIPGLCDAGVIDARPDDCWRCDAVESADALGLCLVCRRELCA